MTLDEGSNSSNKSNSTDLFPKEFLISYAVIQFFLSLFCLFMVMYLSIRLKKRAWDSPAKRFGHFFNVSIALSALSSVAMSFNQYFNFRSPGLLIGILFVTFIPLSVACFLYFIAMYVALSLQVVTPFLPERLKVYAHKTHCVQFLEVYSKSCTFSLLGYWFFCVLLL